MARAYDVILIIPLSGRKVESGVCEHFVPSNMFNLMQIVVFAGTFYLTSWFLGFLNEKKLGRNRRLPPSLPSLPIVGSLPFIKELDALPEYFMKVANKLGPVFSLRFGSRFVVVLNNRESIEDALLRHASSYSGRESIYSDTVTFNQNRKGIAFRNYDEEFKRYQKLVLSILKDFGFGSRSQMETRILTEISELIKHVRDINGKAFNPKELIILSSSNVPMNMMYGRRRDYKDGMTEAVYLMKRFVDGMNPAVDLFPILRYIPPHSHRFNEMAQSAGKLKEAVYREMDLSLLDGATDCFVRSYIEKEGPDYDREQLMVTLKDLLGGSVDTTSVMMLWFFTFIANNPQVADRLQKEIDSVVPRDRLPTIDDQQRLPYVEATILEILRLRAPLPLSLPHLTLHDTEVLGYFIPADTMVFPNIGAVHRNEMDFPDPEVFRPERFLDENNKLINKRSVIPFSIGRRSCMGEGLARDQLFLFISGLMQNFHIRPPEDVESITVKKIFGVVETPSAFEIRMIPRND